MRAKLLHDESPIPSGPGVREESLHQGTGLRTATVTAHIDPPPTHLGITGSLSPMKWGGMEDDLVTPNNTGEAETQWISLRAVQASGNIDSNLRWRGRLPVPMTPCAVLGIFASQTTVRFRFRMTGYDQFGNHIVETTPQFMLEGVDSATQTEHCYFITFSKVFSYIDNLEFTSEGVNSLASAIYLSWNAAIDNAYLEGVDAADFLGLGATSRVRTLGTHVNWGIGTPLRVSPYGTDPLASTFAAGTLTFSGNAADTETVTIGSVVYTFKATLTGAANEVLVGGSAAASAQNLFDAINHSGTPGTQYSNTTVIHPQVRASGVTATTVVVTSLVAGVSGNAIGTTETMGAGAWGATALAGGVDSPQSQFPEIVGASGVLLRQGVTGGAVPNTAGNFSVFGSGGGAPGAQTGVVLGRSAAAANSVVSTLGGTTVTYSYDSWQGTPHKIGFKSVDAFASAPFELNGQHNRLLTGGVGVQSAADTLTELIEDEFMFTFTIRTRLGTRTDSVSGGGYPR